jgi:PAS domain S-box-containing protein
LTVAAQPTVSQRRTPKFTFVLENAKVSATNHPIPGVAMSLQALPVPAQQLFQYLFEQASLGIAVEDLEGTVLLANPALCSMLGYAENELCGMNCSQFANSEDSKDDWALFQELSAGIIDQYSLEKRYVKKDGTRVWGRLNVSLLKNGEGGSPLVFAFLENITERRRTEEVLRETEERFRLAARAGKMFAYEWDASTDVIVRSGECGEIFGTEKVAKVSTGQQILAKVHPDDREKLLAADAALSVEKPDLQVSHRMLHADGSVVWAERTGRAYFDRQGKMLRIVGMVADITERKRAEEILHESERNLVGAQARAHLGSWVETLADHKLVWSDELYRLWGLEPRSVEPNRDVFLGGVHPDDRADLREKLDASLANRQPFDCVHRVLRPDGSVRFAHSQGEPISNEKGQPIQFVGTILDITEQKMAEEALANVSRRLIEAQEQERTRIGRELHDDIGQRLSMLVIGIEHLRRDPPDLSTELHRLMGELHGQASEIAADLQSLSHELHSAKLEYLGLAVAARVFCKDFRQQQKVEIDIETYDLPRPLSTDLSLCFFRILQEALHNSTKHSGVRHFEVRLWGTVSEIHLTVRDSGAGFDREAAKQSRGLGLISMEERLKLVNGTLSIESQFQRGTTIHARAPLSGSNSVRAAG